VKAHYGRLSYSDSPASGIPATVVSVSELLTSRPARTQSVSVGPSAITPAPQVVVDVSLMLLTKAKVGLVRSRGHVTFVRRRDVE
jgi:hypothetical protein